MVFPFEIAIAFNSLNVSFKEKKLFALEDQIWIAEIINSAGFSSVLYKRNRSVPFI